MSTRVHTDLEILCNARGLFVGQLSDLELAAFYRLVHDGLARRRYEGAGGFMGLAKVEIIVTDENEIMHGSKR